MKLGIFRTRKQRLLQEMCAQCKLIISDLSKSFLLENTYPEMRRVCLAWAVRSTQQVVLGANAFYMQDDEPTTCLGRTGPLLKSFIFAVPEGYNHDLFAQFADVWKTHFNQLFDRNLVKSDLTPRALFR